MMQQMTNSRMAGIEILRIISTLMICILHILGRGGGLPDPQTKHQHFLLGSLLKTASYCGVDCYGLISGYVGFRKSPRVGKYVYLWVQIVFLYVWITFLHESLPSPLQRLFFIKQKQFSIQDWKDALFPVQSKKLWYYNAYIGLYWFQKFFSSEHTLDHINSPIALVSIILIFSVFPQLTNKDYFGVYEGYCTLWLLILFVMGGLLRQITECTTINILPCILAYLICILTTWSVYTNILPEIPTFRLSYVSPSVLCAAISLILIFSKMTISNRIKGVVSRVSSLTFGVYVIHCNPIVWTLYLQNTFQKLSTLNPLWYVLSVLVSSLLIFTVCALIDFCRLQFFQLIQLSQNLTLLTENMLPFRS